MDFRNRTTQNQVAIAICVFVVFVCGGCSFFSTKHDIAEADSLAFHATVSADAMPMPLPVEIADDITRIANGEQPAQSGEWRRKDDRSDRDVASVTEPVAEPAAEAQVKATDAEGVAQGDAEAGPSKSQNFHATGGSPSANAHGEKYTVKSGDTLMKISFEKYGNLYRWREILDANRSQLHDLKNLKVGMNLQINGVDYVVIERNGKPYLIRRNDTLVKISKGLYGTPTYWRSLWQNNSQLIHDPNRIYAGLTMYYTDKPEALKSTLTSTTLPSKKHRKPASSHKDHKD